MVIHGIEVCPPVLAANAHLSKPFTCERVLNALRASEVDLAAICTCIEDDRKAKEQKELEASIKKAEMEVDKSVEDDEKDAENEDVDEETEEGFAASLRSEVEKADVHEEYVEEEVEEEGKESNASS